MLFQMVAVGFSIAQLAIGADPKSKVKKEPSKEEV